MQRSIIPTWYQKPDNLDEIMLHLQKMLTDFTPTRTDRVEIAGFCEPSEWLGGDYIGLAPRGSGRWIVSIGDVMGKGPSAAFLTGMIHGALKGVTMHEMPPGDILAFLNRALLADFRRFSAFATFLVSVFDENASTLRWSNAGQNYPILWRQRTQRCELLQLKGVMIGMLDDVQYATREIVLEPGDRVFWYSDGLIELMNGQREPFTLERAIRFLEGHAALPLAQMVVRLQQELHRFNNGAKLSDDISFIALKVLPAGAGG